MVRLDNDPFLNALTECYTSTEKTGTLYITYKQLIETDLPQKRKRKLDKLEGDASCLVRARTPQRKISTVVCILYLFSISLNENKRSYFLFL